ncbi:MAG: HAMP domain-containing sensor histidine kinase [Algoriphagus sp.]|uniref:sensor histidine kinase n=1 Tax=Algoriphagus sp. TaxID=1872435 RepID=UPI00262F2004|nr:HAMP domain-containing sensor histidine kinase [Algoriphagus sp.]MDG1278791.1 HAMP domain-containing sensor histidine kinase [Algoriphagus sp.]
MRLFGTQDLDNNLDQLQNKISLLFALLAGFLMIFLGLSDLIIGLDPFIVKTKFLFAIPYLLGFWVMWKYGYFQPVIQLMIFIGLILVAINYVYNEGYQGPTFYTIFIFVVGIGILIKGWPKIALLLLTFMLYSLLFYGEVHGWFIVTQHYPDLESLYWDHLITIWWTGLFSFLGIQIFLRNYRSQNDSLRLIQTERELAMKELDSLNTKKNQLIALLSHDLKNPIGMLGQTLELADKGLFEEGEMEGILKNLKNQSYHLSGVLNNTLNWVLAELEDKELETETVSLYKFTDEMKDGMLSQAAVKNQTIEFKKSGNDLNIELEASEIRIILKNLLDNAIKFTPVGGEIEFELICSEKEVKWIVKNEGKEIPQKEEITLFDFKVKTTYGTMREKGTGIGLPLCKKIADKLAMELGFSRTDSGKNSFFLTKNLA